MSNVVNKIHGRYTWFFIGFLVITVIILLKILYIQLVLGKELKKMDIAEQTDIIPAVRGDILSRDHKLIATTMVKYNIYFDPLTDYLRIHDTAFYNNVDKLAQELSRLFGDRTAEEYKQMLIKARVDSNRYLPIKKNVSVEQYHQLKKFPIFRLGRNRGGLIAEKELTRVHPFKKLAARTIGSFSYKDLHKPTIGIERGYNAYLEGVDGKAKYRVFRGSTRIISREIDPPQDGVDIISTLDMNLQYEVEKALEEQLKKTNGDFGVAIVMEVKTGEILAMANLRRSKRDSSVYVEDYNNAIAYGYEVGSVMKPLVMLALFEEYPDVDLDKLVNVSTTELRLDRNFVVRDAFKKPLGVVPLEKIIAHSSNVGVVLVVTRYFKDRMRRLTDRLEEIGVTRKTNIDIPGERVFPLKTPSDKDWWNTVSLAQISIGYEHKMTPIQLVSLYNAIANDGHYVTPHLVKAIKEGYKIKELHNQNDYAYEIASKKSVKKVQKLLEKVVEYGTASHTVKSDLVKIAGKTGTAKIYDTARGYVNEYNTTFVGYFPADNPKYTMLVMIHKPLTPGMKTGARAAGPVFKKVAEYLYRTDPDLHPKTSYVVNLFPEQKEIPKVKYGRKDYVISTLNLFGIPVHKHYKKAFFVRALPEGNAVTLYYLQVLKGRVPDVRGMSAEDATYALESLGLKVKLKGKGKVVHQSIKPKTLVKPGETVVLTLN